MTITRVVRDDVEFFTIDATGESGMSESGLARLCGVTKQAVSLFLRDMVSSKRSSNQLEPLQKKDLWCQAKGLSASEKSKISNLYVVRAGVCAKVIKHYAFDSRYKTEEALFAYQNFAELGINTWIQQITDWHGNAVPKTGIVTDFKTIDVLMDKRLDGSSYRVYLVLQKAIRLRMQLTADEIMDRAGISRSAYSTAVTKLDELGLLPEWCKIQRKNQPERVVRDRLQAQLGGKVEAYTKYGLIDLLTETELIEIKVVNRWKDAIGHILAKSEKYPNHQKRLHLFGPQEPILENIVEVCDRLQIRVTFEMVEKEPRQLVIA
jgi:transcriptional regulator with XRE-family HTH domain/predicted transcriptional regulator